MITYDPFWKYCKEHNVSQYSLEKDYGLTHYQLDRLRNNKPITTDTINMLCEVLGISPKDIIDYKKD